MDAQTCSLWTKKLICYEFKIREEYITFVTKSRAELGKYFHLILMVRSFFLKFSDFNWWGTIMIKKGNNFLRYGCRQLTHFGVVQDRIMKLSGWAWFMILWSLSKFELISTTFVFKVSKGGPKKKCWRTSWQFFCIFPLVPPSETMKKTRSKVLRS